MKESDTFEKSELDDIINNIRPNNFDNINNIQKEKKEKIEGLEDNNSNIKSQLNHSKIIKRAIDNLLNNSKEMYIPSEYEINLLLMSSLNNNYCFKSLYFNLIFQFNIINNNIPIVKYIINKMNNLYEKNKEINLKIFIKMFYSYAQFLYEQKHYFYTYYCLRKAKNILAIVQIEKENELKMINSFYFKVLENINAYIKLKNKLFKDRNKISENKLIIISEILDKILKGKEDNKNDINNLIDNNLNEKDDSNLYIISKNWVSKAKKFIDDFNNSLKNGKENNFFDNSFNEDYVLYSYFNEINNSKNASDSFYPGPINNYYLIKNKDSWEDPISSEENLFIEKNFKLNKDYYFINEKNWNILKEIFDCTNEIKIKKSEIEKNGELIKLKALIFEKRLEKNILHNLLKLRIIQIRNNCDIKKLKEKIIRCVGNELRKVKKEKLGFFDKDDENDMEDQNEKLFQKLNIYFYLVDKKNKIILAEICTAFINHIKLYNSTLLKEVNLKEENSINQLLNIYNKKEHILIIEINENSFLQEIKPIKNDNIYACEICNSQITENNKFECRKCNISFLCSEKCFEKSKSHKDFHDYFTPLLKPDFNLKMLNSKEINYNNNSRKGNVVLYNLGNTCYLNSTIHCLSNTIDLTKYFIFEFYKDEQNFIKYNSSSGNVIEEYAQLIKQIWIGKEKVISPEKFRTAFCKMNQNFLGNIKYLPNDFLESLLSTFHDLLNRAYLHPTSDKKKEEKIDKNYIYEKSERLNNNSIISDLFGGQIINVKNCVKCNNNYTSSNNFNILNLSVPKNHCCYSIKYFNEKEYKCFPFSIYEKTTFADLKEKALSYYKEELIQKIIGNKDDIFNKMIYIDNTDKSNLIDYNGFKIPKNILYEFLEVIILNSKKIIRKNKRIKDNENILSFLEHKEKEYEIVLYEKKTISDKFLNIFIFATNFDDKNYKKIQIFKKKKIRCIFLSYFNNR